MAGRAIRYGMAWACASEDKLLRSRISYDNCIIMATMKLLAMIPITRSDSVSLVEEMCGQREL
jgi:hypothetical protein